ncbi:MAG: hypothetical protein ABJB03_04240 [Rhodoglobus sp.]
MRRPAPLPPELARDPFTVNAATTAGVGRQRLRAADLSTPFHGVRTSGSPGTPLELAQAYAVRMPERQFFSHVTAAQLWDFPMRPTLESRPQLDVSVVAPAHVPQVRGVTGHRLSSATGVVVRREVRVVAPATA